MEVTLIESRPPYAAAIVAGLTKQLQQVNFIYEKDKTCVISESPSHKIFGNISIALQIAKNSTSLIGEVNTRKETEIQQWLEFASELQVAPDVEWRLQKLNHILQFKTFLVGYSLTLADLAIYEAFKNNKAFKGYVARKRGQVKHLARYCNFLDKLNTIQEFVNLINQAIKKKTSTSEILKAQESVKQHMEKEQQESVTMDISLPNAKVGEVVTRFPPEASGYLHIGHAKAAMVNYLAARKYKGKLLIRFDDTNPTKEKIEYEHAILEDLKKLGIKGDSYSYTSDHFDIMLQYAEEMIKEGKAYVDDSPKDVLQQLKREGIESKSRNNSIELNLKLWEEMKKGTELGRKCVLRAKMDMQNPNLTLRDPVMYRFKDEPHNRTKDKYKVYPTYDFACPIVDSVEGVTHACRTSEYNDRNEQYYRFCDLMGIRKPIVVDFSRLNVTHAVMSKRKLTKLVEDKVADGWDDPRFPTLRGLFRRGLTVEALRRFIYAQGASKNTATLEIEGLWAINKQIIDPIVPRYHAITKQGAAILNIVDGPEQVELRENPLHPKNAKLGSYKKQYYKSIYLEQEDAKDIQVNEEITLRYWGNVIITDKKVDGDRILLTGKLNLKGDFKSTKLKATWLAVTSDLLDVKTVYYTHLIKKAKLEPTDDFTKEVNLDSKKEVMVFGDPNLKLLKKGDKLQLERKGYFIVDKTDPIVLIEIPDGKMDEAKKLEAKKE